MVWHNILKPIHITLGSIYFKLAIISTIDCFSSVYVLVTHSSNSCKLWLSGHLVHSVHFIHFSHLDYLCWLFRSSRYFVSAGLFVLSMLVGIFEPKRSFVSSNRSFGLLDANLHHLTPFYLFDHLCQIAPWCWLGHLLQFIS